MKFSYFTLVTSLSVLVTGCNKSLNNPMTTNPDTTTTTKTGTTGGTGTTCTAKLTDVDGLQLFPADNSWNQDISAAAVDPYSNQIIAQIGNSGLHPDFGSGLYAGVPIGIPFDVVCGGQAKVKVTFRSNAYDGNYGTESDPGPYPIPLNAPIEGNGQGDSHVIVVDKDNKVLYELYNASLNNGHWQASSGAIFNLNSDKLRPAGWTSADAAGLPIFPGLVRYDEIAAGVINHPIRFTLSSQNVASSYISPARHSVNSSGGQYALPFGARIRLKASFNISHYSAHLQVILKAMKKYGLILADIGSNMYISGAPDSRWNNDELHQLGAVIAADFEVVKFH
jgi:hypothetical protein